MTAAPAADQEAQGEHAHERKGAGDHGDAPWDHQGIGQEGPDQQPAGGGQDGAGEVCGFFERTPVMADGIGPYRRADEQVDDHRRGRERRGGTGEH